MIYRLLTILIVLQVNGCVYVPLPDEAPPLQEVQLPRTGDSVAAVRRIFGDPQVLDSGRYLLYDWTTDRALVILPAYPTGVPVATVVAGQRFLMKVVLDDAQRVSSIECSVDKLDSHELKELGCLDTKGMQTLAGHGEWRELADIAELADIRFWHSEATGANTNMVLSPDGSVLAATDVKNRTWIIDLESFTLIGRSDNIRANLLNSWLLKGTPLGLPEPRSAFSEDGRRLVITQGELTSLLIREGNKFIPEAQLNGHALKIARFVCCPTGLMGLGSDGAFLISLGGEIRSSVKQEGRLSFGVFGVSVTRRSPPGALRIVALDSSILARSPRAVFAESDHDNVVLDTRTDFERHESLSPANYEFSPDGQWLARNDGQHLELWDSRQLLERLSVENSAMITPVQAMMMPLPSETYFGAVCHGPIAFHPDGKLVAAASNKAIHVWRIDGGTLEILLDVEGKGHGLHVVAIAFDTNYRLTAIVSDYRGEIHVARWRLPDTL